MYNEKHMRFSGNRLLLLTVFMFLSFILNLYSQTFTKVTTGNLVNDNGNSFGCSWNDYDNDGYLDLFVANYLNQNNFLYHNRGDLTFEKILNGNLVNDSGNSISCSWGDYDNDGDLDLFVTNWGLLDFLYQNNGDGTFTRITEIEIVKDGENSMGCSWCDYDNDGRLDLFITNYARSNSLFHNNGNHKFTRILEGDIVTDKGFSANCAWGDYDNDGYSDLFVANWGQKNFLYHNNGNGTFTKITEGDIVNLRSKSLGGSWADYDNDGYSDLFVTNWDRNNFLFHNNGDGSFTRITGDPVVSDRGFFCSSSWGDYDNDGDLDLFVANWGEATGQKNLLYENNGDGSFTKVTTGDIVNDQGRSIGSSWGDIDNDGDLDLFVTNDGENNFFYLNNGNNNSWINIKCIGKTFNSSAIGTKIRVKATINGNSAWQLREITGQTGYTSQNSLNAEFGLKDASVIELIEIKWPNGIIQQIPNVEARQFLTVFEPTIRLEVPTEVAILGDTARVPINVKFPPYFTFSSAQLKIGGYFDKLEFIDVETNSSLAGDHQWIYEVNEVNSSALIWLAGAEDISGEGVLFWMKFFVSANDTGVVPIIIENALFNTGKISVEVTSGGINVTQPAFDKEIAKVAANNLGILPEYELNQNYPNPFNPSTTINYSLKETGIVQLSIYNEVGNVIRNLVSTTQSPGNHSVVWDGRNENNELVSSGVYFYILKIDGNVVTNRRMTLIK